MPRYEYTCNKCGESKEEFLLMKDRYSPEKIPCNCGGKMKLGFGGMTIGDPHKLGIIKPPAEFREVMRRISKGNKNNTMNI